MNSLLCRILGTFTVMSYKLGPAIHIIQAVAVTILYILQQSMNGLGNSAQSHTVCRLVAQFGTTKLCSKYGCCVTT